MAKAPRPVAGNCAGNGLTSTSPQRVQAAAANTTHPAVPPHNPPMPNITHPKLVPHTRPAVVTGPTSWENGRDPVVTKGAAKLRGATRADADPTK
jgi:hypothetical protein